MREKIGRDGAFGIRRLFLCSRGHDPITQTYPELKYFKPLVAVHCGDLSLAGFLLLLSRTRRLEISLRILNQRVLLNWRRRKGAEGI